MPILKTYRVIKLHDVIRKKALTKITTYDEVDTSC